MKVKKNNIAIGTVRLCLAALMLSSVMASVVAMNQLQFPTVEARAYDGNNMQEKRMRAMQFTTPSTISQDGSEFTAQAELSDFVVRRTNNIVNTLSYYDIVFHTTSTAPIKTIEVTFPEGTIVSPLGLLIEA
jgi:hypothetical protein